MTDVEKRINPFKAGEKVEAAAAHWKPQAATAGSKIKHKIRNQMPRGSKRAVDPETGKKIGSVPKKDYSSPGHEELAGLQQTNRINARAVGGSIAFLGGLGAGSTVGGKVGDKRYPDAKKLYQPKTGVSKGVYKITEVGSAGEKIGNFAARHPNLHAIPGKKTAAVSGVAGVGLGYRGGLKNKETEQKIYRKRQAKAAAVAKRDPFEVEKRLNATPEERKKALWYNEDFSAKKSKYTKDERQIAGKITGKERLKGQATHASVGAVAGGVAGAVVGRRMGRPKIGAAAGGYLGAVSGQMRGDYVGAVKGQRKYKAVLGKSASTSAFGVSHA